MLPAHVWKGLCGPVAQAIEWISSLFEPPHNVDGASDRLTNRIDPMILECLDKMRVLRELLRKDSNAFCKRPTFILLQIPICEVYFSKEAFHCFRVMGEEVLIDISGIPFQQDVAEIENDGFDSGGHAPDCSTSVFAVLWMNYLVAKLPMTEIYFCGMCHKSQESTRPSAS